MSRKEKYKSDAKYRAEVNKANRDRYHRNMKNPIFAKLSACRGRISNARVALEHHEERVKFFHSRIQRDLKLIEQLQGQVKSQS